MHASVNGHTATVKVLLDGGASVDMQEQLVQSTGRMVFLDYNITIAATEQEGLTALMMASREGYVEIAKALLNAGANPNVHAYYSNCDQDNCVRKPSHSL
jgi:ankyrin repeat protein